MKYKKVGSKYRSDVTNEALIALKYIKDHIPKKYPALSSIIGELSFLSPWKAAMSMNEFVNRGLVKKFRSKNDWLTLYKITGYGEKFIKENDLYAQTRSKGETANA